MNNFPTNRTEGNNRIAENADASCTYQNHNQFGKGTGEEENESGGFFPQRK